MSDVGSISNVGGAFQMDGLSYDLDTLMMTLQMERANNIEQQLVDQANEVKKRNATLQSAQAVLAKLRQSRPEDTDGKASVPNDKIVGPDGTEVSIRDFLKDNGMWDSGKGWSDLKQTKYDQVIENVKGFMDSLNSSSQMDMIRLQSLTNKRNQAFDMMSNMISKLAKSRDGIISNIR